MVVMSVADDDAVQSGQVGRSGYAAAAANKMSEQAGPAHGSGAMPAATPSGAPLTAYIQL